MSLLPYTMREVREALVKLPPKDRHGIMFVIDSGDAEIERLKAETERWREWAIKAQDELNPALARIRKLEVALRFVVNRRDLVFAEFADAEEILKTCEDALTHANNPQ